MRVFGVGTGRCGTCTLYQACTHIENYTSGHETQAGIVSPHEYSDNHIEISSQLVLEIPTLKEKYPDAVFVHVIRDKDSCVESLLRNCWDAMEAYASQWHQTNHPYDTVIAASKFYDQVNAMCMFFSEIRIELESPLNGWQQLWSRLGAEGNYAESVIVWDKRYNAREHRGRDNCGEDSDALLD